MNDFSRQFAVMMPNGELLGQMVPDETAGNPADDFSVPSPMRDMMQAMCGMHIPAAPRGTRFEPFLFSSRRKAEEHCGRIREHTKEFGVMHWGGVVVERLCTPFTVGDPGVKFRDEVIVWLRQQEGDTL